MFKDGAPFIETGILQELIKEQVNAGVSLVTRHPDTFEAVRHVIGMGPVHATHARGDTVEMFLLRRAAILRRADSTKESMESWPELHEAEKACIEGGAMNMDRLRELYIPDALLAVEYRPPELEVGYTPDALADVVKDFILEFSDGVAPVFVDRVCSMVDADQTNIIIEYEYLKRCSVLEKHLRDEPDEMRGLFSAGLKWVADMVKPGYVADKEAKYPGLTEVEAKQVGRHARSVFHVGVVGLPDVVDAGRVDPSVMGRFVTVPGVVELVHAPQPKVVVRVYRCSRNENHKHTVIQDPNPNVDTPKPTFCIEWEGKCKGRLTESDHGKRCVQTQIVRIREPDDGRGADATPRRLDLHLENGMVGGMRVGERVYATGVIRVKREPIRGRPKVDDGVGAYYSDVCGIEYVDGMGRRTATRVERDRVGPADIDAIERRRKEPDCLQWAMGLMSPQLVGDMYNVVRKALVYAECAPLVYETGRNLEWGRVHILVAGDQGTGKTVMLRNHERLVSGARYVNAGVMSGAGFAGSAAMNGRAGRYEAVPGVAVMCHKSTVCVDEGNRWRKDERQARNEVMESGTVTLTKAHFRDQHWDASAAIFEVCNASTKEGDMRAYDDTVHLVDNLQAYDQTELTRFGLLVRLPGKYDLDRMVDGLAPRGDKQALNEHERLLRLWFIHARRGSPDIPDDVWVHAKKRCKEVTAGYDHRLQTKRAWNQMIRMAVGSANFWGVDKVRIEDVEDVAKMMEVCRDAAAPVPVEPAGPPAAVVAGLQRYMRGNAQRPQSEK